MNVNGAIVFEYNLLRQIAICLDVSTPGTRGNLKAGVGSEQACTPERRKNLKAVMTMASSKEYLDFILEQLSGLDEITYKAMMGEYIIYYRGKIVGGIYDNRFLVKPIQSAKALMPEAKLELPYEGAKEMLLVDDIDNREFLVSLIEAMYDELPAPKKKK